MLDTLLLKLVQLDANKARLDPMQPDAFEQPAFYAQWIAPVRHLLAMRYLHHKKRIIHAFSEQGIYPIFPRDYLNALEEQLQHKAWFSWMQRPGSWFSCFSMIVFYPVLLAALLFAGWQLHQWYVDKKMHLALADRVPYYSELLHRTLVAQQYADDKLMAQYLAQANAEKQNILALMPDTGRIHTLLKRALESMQDDSTSNAQIMGFFKELNAELDVQQLPYYLSPKLFVDECSQFAPGVDKQENAIINLLDRLMREQAVETKNLCRTGIITTYHVTKRNELDYQQETAKAEELPLYHVTRADRVPAADGALGLTFKSQGIGSLILLDQIQRFAEQSILPALTFQGRPYIIPYWLQGYYDIEESITKNYKSDLTQLFSSPESLKLLRAAAKEMLLDQQHLSSSRMQQTLQRSRPPSLNETGLLGGLDAISSMMDSLSQPVDKPAQKAAKREIDTLMTSLLPSIEYHEAYHQIIKIGWVKPSWVAKNFSEMSRHGVESSLEELGAYLTQLVYTDTGHKIWLTKLLLFSLNSMTKDQPEYYASSMIFSAMQDLYLLREITPNHQLTVEEKVAIYKILSGFSVKELQNKARTAFEVLFERPVVSLQ